MAGWWCFGPWQSWLRITWESLFSAWVYIVLGGLPRVTLGHCPVTVQPSQGCWLPLSGPGPVRPDRPSRPFTLAPVAHQISHSHLAAESEENANKLRQIR
jgi:hypothetical protein